ncbi:hypothetical protein PMSD_09385 [Paenibacillus macquariensis subsp. defensor]|nr:hypothetical protein PMSD_09385 [Paenibacillus macquariensis subsp. defensor]
MVSELTIFYRLTLNEGKSIITIREELRQVRSNIDIHKIKHVDRLDVSFDIQFSVLEYDTLKLIFQSFVEKALNYAMFKEPLHIRIIAQVAIWRIIRYHDSERIRLWNGSDCHADIPGDAC